MKITTPDGLVIEISDGETIPAELMPILTGAVTVETVSSNPLPASNSFHPIDEFFQGMKHPTRARHKRQPSKCYLTQREYETISVLLQHPEGITSEDVATLLGVTHSAASSTINRIRNVRGHANHPDLLINRMVGGLFVVSPLGQRLTYIPVSKRQAPALNRQLGWN